MKETRALRGIKAFCLGQRKYKTCGDPHSTPHLYRTSYVTEQQCPQLPARQVGKGREGWRRRRGRGKGKGKGKGRDRKEREGKEKREERKEKKDRQEGKKRMQYGLSLRRFHVTKRLRPSQNSRAAKDHNLQLL